MLSLLTCLAFLPLSAGESAAVDEVFYQNQVKPLLAGRCFACHGALKQEAQLRLDTVAAMAVGGDSGPAIVAGVAEESLLLLRVGSDDLGERMPPEHEGEAFSAEQIEILRKWIEAGALQPADEKPEPDPNQHWAYRPLVRPPVPLDIASDAVRNPIDAFIAQQYQQLQLTPAADAEPMLLLRRLNFDLLGLPPTADEIAQVNELATDAAAAAALDDWYAATVEQKLADPRHGQRWARHWMDIWRFSDWWGLGDELRNSQKNIYHWRDWIVDNLNRDRSYATMVELMLAGDELAPTDLEEIRATGFLARNFYLFNRHPWMDETVEHVGKAFLGLTTNCAKCHDHKFDPISQVEYFQLRAIFEPYHVRMDMLPSQADLSQDGIPRVFDGLLEEPTYRLIRGDEKQPDTTRVIEAGVPSFLNFTDFEIYPVALPVEAWQPGSRAWVIENHIEKAEQSVLAAKNAADAAHQRHQESRQHLAQVEEAHDAKSEIATAELSNETATTSAVLLDEAFELLDPEKWQWFGGKWEHQPGRLQQQQDGAQHAALRWRGKLPRDFEVSFQFRIQGGSQWRSVGLSFDESQVDPLAPATSEDSTQNVYVSAFAGGPKVQAAWRQAANWHYPGEATKPQAIELDRSYTLRVQVRDSLINAYLDDQLVIVWRTPLARREGFLQLTTFDALATIEKVRISTLPPEVRLEDTPDYQPDPKSLIGARWHELKAEGEWRKAQHHLSLTEAELESIRHRAAAMQSRNSSDDGLRQQLTEAAVTAERQVQVAAAKLALVDAELQFRLKSQSTTRAQDGSPSEIADDESPALQEARAKLAAAEAALSEQATDFTPLVGARWSPTRFQFSGHDDPTIAFPETSTGRRTALAKWITHPQNPLTARVAVNHIWSRHFGKPLVDSIFDFGRNGTSPSHPELLDWLACELIDSGWSMKHLHRLIVNSSTYRMAPGLSPADQAANLALDPDNHNYWRFPGTRMESQVVRDSLLELAGQLDASPGGPAILPDQQASSLRRSMYFFHSNNQRNDFLLAFDEAAVAECYQREQSVVPQQALALANGELTTRLIPMIADRMREYCIQWNRDTQLNDGDESYIRVAFQMLLGRDASEREVDYCLQAMLSWRNATETVDEHARSQVAQQQLIWVLLNHNDFITVQ